MATNYSVGVIEAMQDEGPNLYDLFQWNTFILTLLNMHWNESNVDSLGLICAVSLPMHEGTAQMDSYDNTEAERAAMGRQFVQYPALI